MTDLVHERGVTLSSDAGETYARVRAYARPMAGGGWEGWLEFETQDGDVLVTDRETTQSKREDVAYWAEGLEPVYLEGALTRAAPVSVR
jgi:hypothetical protein